MYLVCLGSYSLPPFISPAPYSSPSYLLSSSQLHVLPTESSPCCPQAHMCELIHRQCSPQSHVYGVILRSLGDLPVPAHPKVTVFLTTPRYCPLLNEGLSMKGVFPPSYAGMFNSHLNNETLNLEEFKRILVILLSCLHFL